MYQNSYPDKRYKHTINFLKKHISNAETILDLGVENPFTKVMQEHGYRVDNTLGEDLDIDTSAIKNSDAKVVTAFEIFEHLLSPFTVLQSIKTDKLVASIPLRLWFSSAYRDKHDKRSNHFHEFEDWQFDWLLEKAGWKIIDKQKWTNPTKKIGFRPILRLFTPRYYIIYAERI